MLISEVRRMLDGASIPYEEIPVPTRAEHIRLLGFPCSESLLPLRLLTIRNPHHNKHIHLLFQDNPENPAFSEVWFGGFTPDFARSTDEFLRSALPEFIGNVLSGRMHIIEKRIAQSGAWAGDAMYLDSPDEAENDMDEFEAALRRIRSPHGWLHTLLFGREIHEIYSWTQYEQIGPARNKLRFPIGKHRADE